MRPTAIRSLGRNSTTSLPGTDRLAIHAAELFETGLPVVLAGDYNVVPEPRDIYPTRSYDDNALVQPGEPRTRSGSLLDQGWLDALRKSPSRRRSSIRFWDYRRNRWERDAGLRLDHILLSRKLKRRLGGAGVDRDARGLEGAERPCAHVDHVGELKRSPYHWHGEERTSLLHNSALSLIAFAKRAKTVA